VGILGQLEMLRKSIKHLFNMPKEITIKLTFDETWDSYEEENIADDFYVIDAIRDLAPGVVWQIQKEEDCDEK